MEIVVSRDRKSAIIHLATHSVNLSSDTDVTELIMDLYIKPKLEYLASLEVTQVIALEAA